MVGGAGTGVGSAAGETVHGAWEQLPHDSGCLYQSSGAPVLPDLLVFQEKVEMWILYLSIPALAADLYFGH